MRERVNTIVLTQKNTFIKGWTTMEDGKALGFQIDRRFHPHLDEVVLNDTKGGVLVKYDLRKSYLFPRKGIGPGSPSW